MSKKPRRDTFSADAVVTTADGVQVPVEITVAYPPNMGLHAVRALNKVAESSEEIYSQLISQGDTSVMNAMVEALNENPDD